MHRVKILENANGFPADTSGVLKQGIEHIGNINSISGTGGNVNREEPVETTVIKTVEDRISAKIENSKGELSNNQRLLEESNAEIDRNKVSVQIDIKKSPQKNKFWVHSIDIKEKVDEVPSDTSRVLKRGYSLTNSTKSISHTERNVNSSDSVPIQKSEAKAT